MLITKINNNPNKNVSFGTKPMPKNIAERIFKAVKQETNINIFTHSSPDEDTVCCAKVIYNWLRKMGKSVSLSLNENDLGGLFINSANYKIKKNNQQNSDLLFLLDFNSPVRIPKGYTIDSKSAQNKVIGLDHHEVDKNSLLDGNSYIDTESKSCSGIVFRFFEALGIPLAKKDMENLYCGILSDYKKIKYISYTQDQNNKSVLVKSKALLDDKNSLEVLDRVESSLSPRSKSKIYAHLDVLANLTAEEKAFKDSLPSMVQVTPNGKLAYVIISPDNKQWMSLGCDETRNSIILSDLRQRLINNNLDSENFTAKQKEQLKNIKGTIVFYRESPESGSIYKMSLLSKDDYTMRLISYIKTHLNPELVAGGHSERAGGSINSCAPKDVNQFINNFLIAADKVK